MKIVHVIPNLGPGGPTRSLAVFVEWSAHNRPTVTHHIVTLEPRLYPLLALRLRRHGATILQNADTEEIKTTLAHGDVVLFHFWNTPLIWLLLAQPTPPMRAAIWTQVRGDSPPQCLNANLLRSAAGVALAAHPPARLQPEFEHVAVVPTLIQPDRVVGLMHRPHDGFRVDYVGTTNSGKLDASIFPIVSNLTIPDVKVRIYGGALEPALAQAHAAMADPSRIEVCGFTENVAAIFATTDVFAYPMAESSYGGADLALQEAMLAGLPVVVYANRGSSHFVENGKTGLVVSSPAEFTAAIERLYREPALRCALGAAARNHAAAEFEPHKHAERLFRVVADAATAPKRMLFETGPASIDIERLTPASLFLVSQGWPEDEAAEAVAAWIANADPRVSEFAETASDACYKIEGGVVHWRNHRPDDPLLRAWSGYWLRRSGRHEQAKHELDVALRLGAHPRAIARLAGIDDIA
jgi:hypothetical protein